MSPFPIEIAVCPFPTLNKTKSKGLVILGLFKISIPPSKTTILFSKRRMIIEKNKVVSLEYHLTNDDGETIDSNRGGETLDYLHGVGNLIKGLEEALEGKQAGEEFSLSIPPEKGYGVRRDELVETVARHEFEDPEELEVGMEFELPIDEENTTVRVVISEISGDEITIDANHELAGMNLNFEIRVDSIRDASPLEIENQHALVSGENHS